MDKLTELAIKYKTDKWGKHHYTPHYYEMFRNNSKRRRVKKVLEIGVGEGAGLRMFRDFFPNAMIYAADNKVGRLFKENRIKVFLCDQSKGHDLIYLFGNVGLDMDLVIDDGSHKPKDQVYTCMSVMPRLKKDCIYVIEDVADISILEPISKIYSTNTIECGERYDDRLIVVKHK